MKPEITVKIPQIKCQWTWKIAYTNNLIEDNERNRRHSKNASNICKNESYEIYGLEMI